VDMCYNKPMKVKLITVGKLKEKYLKDGIAEYVKRLGRFTKFESIELTDERRQIMQANLKIKLS
jgi:23S rRNA (pseudouridine1915-N3)-methyltransferase